MQPLGIRKSLKCDNKSSGAWRKSSYSSYTGNCVEIGGLVDDNIRVRDSKNPRGAILEFTTAGWDAFVGAIREDSNRGNRS
jgi:hypothetical protein